MKINVSQTGNQNVGNINVEAELADYLLACIALVKSGKTDQVVLNSGTGVGSLTGTISAS